MSYYDTVGMILDKDEQIILDRFRQSLISKLGAGALEIILVLAIASNYFGYITINEPYYKIVITVLLAQTLGVPYLTATKKRTPQKAEFGLCPHCNTSYSIIGYECERCGYTIPNPNKK